MDTSSIPGLELIQVADVVAREKSIEREEVMLAMEEAIQKAGRAKYGLDRDIRAMIDRKTGARGLRSILEDILLDTMFDLPGMDSVEEVVVNEEAVTSDAAPLMIHAEKKREPATAG